MAQKDLGLKVNIDVQDNVDNSIGRLRELRNEIRNVSAGSDDFRKLRAEMDDIEDSLKSAKVGAGNLTDVLSQVPGPIGDIGSAASGTIDTLKGLGKLNVKDIKASFISLKDDIGDAAKGLANITGISKAYTVINNALAASFIKVGVAEGVAATGAKILSAALISTGIGALVVLLGTAIGALMEFASGEKEAKAATDAFNASLEASKKAVSERNDAINRSNAESIAELKANGATEKQIRETQLQQTKTDLINALNDRSKAYQILRDAYAIEDEEARKEAIDKARANFDAANKAFLDNQSKFNIKKSENRAADNADAKAKADEIAKDEDKKAADAAQRLKEDIAKRKAYKEERARIAKEIALTDAMQRKQFEDLLVSESEARINQVELDRQIQIQALKDKGLTTAEYNKKLNQIEADAYFKRGELAKEYNAKIKEGNQLVKEIEADTIEERRALELEASQKRLYDLKENYDAAAQLAAIQARKDITDTEELNIELNRIAEENTLKKIAFEEKYGADKIAINKKYNEEQAVLDEEENAKQLEKLEFEAESNAISFEDKIARLAAEDELINKLYADNEEKRTELLAANAEQRKAIEQAEFEFKMSKVTAGMDLAMQAGQFLQQIAGKNKKLAIAGVIVEQAASIGKIIANTAVANAKAAAAMPLTGGMPFVAINTVAAGISIASAIASAAKAIQQINAAESGGGGGGAAPAAAPPPSKFGAGGLATGPLHANGGISTPIGEMEGGEYIVNRASTASFLPLLETINSMGRGMGIDQGNLSSGVENQMMAMSQAPIVKTYVVASDMTSQQEANKRISDIARL
jgi:hypothetical protein